MAFWVVTVLVIVVGVKYYTANEMRKLERRLGIVKEDLRSAKERLREVEKKQDTIKSEETEFEGRVSRTKEVIEDIQMRMSAKEEAPEPEDVGAA